MPVQHDTIKVIQTVYDTVLTQGVNGLDVLNKVDEFYQHCWEKLLIFITIALTLLGVIIPFLLFQVEKRNSKALEERLERKIDSSLDVKLKEELDKERNTNGGTALFLQGIILRTQLDYYDSFKSYISSITLYRKNLERNYLFIRQCIDQIDFLLVIMSRIKTEQNPQHILHLQEQIAMIKNDTHRNFIGYLNEFRNETVDDYIIDKIAQINLSWNDLFTDKKDK